jgi:hypothetical protein
MFVTFLVTSLVSSVADAQVSTAQELPTTARMMALGGNAQATAQSTSGVFSNPAAMTLGRVYHVDSAILYDPTIGRWMFGTTIADTTRKVSASLSYMYGTTSGNYGNNSIHDARLGLGFLLTDGVALGTTIRYLNTDGPLSANGVLGTNYGGITVDVGAIVRPASFISFAATGYSLTNPDTALSPLSVGGGIALTPIESLNIIGDMVWDLRSYASPRLRFNTGVEFLLDQIPLRVGYLYDNTRLGGPVHTVTAGIGYLDTAFGIEAALRQDVAGAAVSQTTMLLNLRYFYRAL